MASFLTSPVILQILPALQQGGVERGTLEMAQAITQAGGTALVASSGGRLVPLLRSLGAEHITLPECGSRNPAHVLRNTRILRRILTQHNVALVHARSRIPAWMARMACRRTQTAFVTTWHGVHANTVPGKKLYNSVLASGNRVIAISEHIARILRQDYNVPPQRLRVIPRGADITQFSPDAVSGQRMHQLAEQWNVPAGSAIILMPGRLSAWKGQSLVLQALAQLEAGLPEQPWHCVFAGSDKADGQYVRELTALAHSLGLSDRIRFAGHCEDMPAAMALATMVLVPSLRPEPFGRVVVEAQAMCRPVIVSHHGAAVETVDNGVTGLSVPPNNAAALADAMFAILTAPAAALATMGTNARLAVMAHYTTEAMQHATLGVYDELLNTQLAPTFLHTKNAAAPFQDHDLAG
ncbi:glycosyl transferase [Acetobacter syzygii]|uniref:glycosyltransferase family 4 protein n=1 Tax=Acetobacter syzygii TaxID=146476 RepID=UPI0005DBF983|nr:glycosyltransferase family 4 protein [Acetobacter syzygii]GAN71672.1 glycosyl transferase [Acetobacter syzygii]GBR62324.1 glycosyltransferase [Acetobacter syzygii NRIC 0483]GEL56491.1 glycosyl transferase [Acetobacter syzygii]